VEKPWIRNTYLKFDDEKLIITARNFRSAAKVVNLHKDWITKHYSQISRTIKLFGSNSILFNGSQFEALYVPHTGRTRLEISQNRISVYSKSTRLAEGAIDKWLALQTKLFTDPVAGEKAQIINKQRPIVGARRCGKWGVCKSNNTITFNSYLCMLPSDIREYIVSHEVAHLAQMNHSARFWEVVSQLCPNYREMRKRLKSYDNKRRNIYSDAQVKLDN
jgi:predicted metal-dependent hydrolase